MSLADTPLADIPLASIEEDAFISDGYYFRTDGTAANLAAAIGPPTDPTKCGDQPMLESSDFSAGGNNIYLSNNGASDWVSIDLLGALISGVNGSPNVLIGDGVYNTTNSAANHILRFDGGVTDVEYVTVNNFWAQNTALTNSSACFIFFADVGVASNTSININNCQARNVNGDGFSQASGGSGHVNYTGCDTVDCGSNDTADTHQGWTAHNTTHTATLTTCTGNGNAMDIGFVGGSVGTWVSGSSTGNLYYIVKVEDANTLVNVESGVTMNVDNTACRGWDVNTGGATININGATVNITAALLRTYLRTGGNFNVTGGNWLVNSTAFRINAINDSNATFTGVNIDLRASSRFIDSATTGTITFTRCEIDCTNMASTNPLVRHTGAGNVIVTANKFIEIDGISAGDIIDIEAGATGDNVTILHNTVYNASSGGNFVDDNTSDGVNLKSNIFYNVNLVCAGTAFKADYNCYYNSSDEGGANSITSDPQFTTPGTDFTLQQGSPAIAAGEAGPTVTTDYAGNAYKASPAIGAYEYTGPIGVIPQTLDKIEYQHSPITAASLGGVLVE